MYDHPVAILFRTVVHTYNHIKFIRNHENNLRNIMIDSQYDFFITFQVRSAQQLVSNPKVSNAFIGSSLTFPTIGQALIFSGLLVDA